MEFAIFFFFAAVAVIFALVVVLHRNPVVGALSLVASFFALAVMYVLLEAPFLAVLQVIVYAGAIMVLFLFVIMLLNLQHMAEPATRPIQQFLGYTTAAAFGLGLLYFIVKFAVFSALPAGPFVSDSRAIGKALFEEYVFPFEMVSILLLAAIVGALVLSGRSMWNPERSRGVNGATATHAREISPAVRSNFVDAPPDGSADPSTSLGVPPPSDPSTSLGVEEMK